MTSVVGKEYDLETHRKLKRVFQRLNGKIGIVSNSIGGSQELDEYQVLIGTSVIKVESETYIGITISGDDDLIMEIEKRLGSEI